MGFALKTALFGISLRKTSLILLHIHLINCVFTSLNKLSDQGSVISKLIKGDIGDWAIGVLLIKSLAIECYIFMVAIWSIFKQKSTNIVLSVTLVVVLLNSLYLVYVVIVINFGVHHELKANRVNGSLKMIASSSQICEMNKLSVFNLLINSYTALVIYSYCVELKNQCLNNVLPTYSCVHYKRDGGIETDLPPAYEDLELESIAPFRDPHETASNV